MAEINSELHEYWTMVRNYRTTGCKKAYQWLIGMNCIKTSPILTKALKIFWKGVE